MRIWRAPGRRLTRRTFATWWFRALAVLGLLVCLVFVIAITWNVSRGEYAVALVAPVPPAALWFASRAFWFGIYDSEVGLVINGLQ